MEFCKRMEWEDCYIDLVQIQIGASAPMRWTSLRANPLSHTTSVQLLHQSCSSRLSQCVGQDRGIFPLLLVLRCICAFSPGES